LTKRFFILGDSWGCGEWEYIGRLLQLIPNTGVGYYLEQRGHLVTNVAQGSASNFGQLRHANYTLLDDSNYDYIIWFHTEPIRDIIETIINDPCEGAIQYPHFTISDYFKALSYIHTQNYNYAQEMYNNYKIPFIVIGCNSAVHSIIDEYTFTEKIIYSWANELLALPECDLPANWRLERLEIVLQYYKDIINKKQILNEITKMEELDKRMVQVFPDGMHPGRKDYENLTERLLTEISHE
jgi:hypothetical protein